MKGINMNKQERKECQYSDYYRMTGEGYHTGLRCLKNLFLFHHWHLCIGIENVSKNQPFFEDIYYIECLENLDWRFRPKPL